MSLGVFPKGYNNQLLPRTGAIEMFGFKSKKKKLEAKLLDDAYKLSHTNRKLSDQKAVEAEELRKQIYALENKSASQ